MNMEMKDKTSIRRRIHSIYLIALPLVIQGMVFQLQSLTDKAFLGNLDSRYVSAAGAAQMPYCALIDSMVAISTGIIIVVSKLFGAKRQEEIPSYIKSACFYNTLIGIAIFFMWQFFAEPVLFFFRLTGPS